MRHAGALSCAAAGRRRTRCGSNSLAAGGCRTRFPRSPTWSRRSRTTPPVQRLTFETTALSGWDSGLVTFLLDLMTLRSAAPAGGGPARDCPRGCDGCCTSPPPSPSARGRAGRRSGSPSSTRVGQETLAPDRIGGRPARVHRRGRVRPGGTSCAAGRASAGSSSSCSSRSAAPRPCRSSP